MSLDEEWEQPEAIGAGKPDTSELLVATERPTGRTLRELTAETRLDQRRALLIIREVLEALGAMHAAGEIHGDVTPENIVVLPGLGDDRIELRGGVAKAGAAKPGNPVYSAPEAALGGIDARADIYSAGAVLFELLTGRPPFFADDPSALRRLHAYAPVQTLTQRALGASFPDALEHVVATALAKKRDARFQATADMIAALDPALQAIEDAEERPQLEQHAERRRIPNDSLLVLAKDLMPKPPSPTGPATELLVPVNVDRKVPELPWRTRAGLALRRLLARARPIAAKLGLAKLGATQKRILVGIAATLVLVLVIVVATGGDDEPRANGPTVAQDPAVLVDQRCERLGRACGDTDKHADKIIAQCKQVATKHVEKGCADAALAVYECYERELCGKTDRVWALDDLRVLADRQYKCVSERRARSACGGN